METNGANGGHQHEVFEKRPSPGTFPHRLDIELCICGVRRWVDQDGAPTTPWQFIRLGAKPGGNEGAGAALPAPPKSALDGLITCGSCGQPMLLRRHPGRSGSQLLRLPAGTRQPLGPVPDTAAARPPDRGAAGWHGAADSPDRGRTSPGW